MIVKKTIVLSSLTSPKEKAVVNFDGDKTSVKANIKLYNFKAAPEGLLSLAVLSDGKVERAPLRKNAQFSFVCDFPSPLVKDNFSCAIVNSVDGEIKPILSGSDGGGTSIEKALISSISLLNKPNLKAAEAKEVLDNAGIDYDEEEKKHVDKEIDKNLGLRETSECEFCKYREAFYNDTVMPCMIKPKKLAFYEEIKPELDKLFADSEEEKALEEIIPNSKWAKVECCDDGEFYVVGVIYEGEDVKFICYGVPGVYSTQKPKDLGEGALWLPLDETKPYELGYWITYQNAETGENEEVEII